MVFQAKLAIDALRDLLLSPVSLTCAFIDVIQNNSPERSYYKKLMKLGHYSDDWLGLFVFRGADNDTPDEKTAINDSKLDEHKTGKEHQQNIDKLFDKIEQTLEQQLANGATSAYAKQLVEKHLTKISQLNKQQDSKATDK